MNAQEAAKLAIQRAQEFFKGEGLENLGLEELEYEEASDHWLITIGFSRPWDHYETNPILGFSVAKSPRRDYKVVRVSNDGEVISIKNRPVETE